MIRAAAVGGPSTAPRRRLPPSSLPSAPVDPASIRLRLSRSRAKEAWFRGSGDGGRMQAAGARVEAPGSCAERFRRIAITGSWRPAARRVETRRRSRQEYGTEALAGGGGEPGETNPRYVSISKARSRTGKSLIEGAMERDVTYLNSVELWEDLFLGRRDLAQLPASGVELRLCRRDLGLQELAVVVPVGLALLHQ